MQRFFISGFLLCGLFFSNIALSSNSSVLNLRISPAALALGAVNIEADIVLNRYYTIAPMYTLWNFESKSDFEADITAYGLRVDYHANRVFRQGLLYGMFVKRWDIDIQYVDNDKEVNSVVSVDTIGVTGGYRWMWRSFNVTAEFGYRLMVFNGFDFKLESGDETKVNVTDISMMGGTVADVSVGWVF